MARDFDGTDDQITVGSGDLAWDFGSMWAVVLLDDVTSNQRIVTVLNGSTNRNSLMISNTGVVRASIAGNTSLGTTGLSTNVWYLLGWSKATGTAAVRIHIFNYSTEVWTHENGDTNLADATATDDSVRFGASGTSTQFFNGRIEAAGILNSVALTDAQFENLAQRLIQWHSAPTTWFVILDQESTSHALLDRAGLAVQSAITGTAIASESSPIGYTGLR